MLTNLKSNEIKDEIKYVEIRKTAGEFLFNPSGPPIAYDKSFLKLTSFISNLGYGNLA